MRAALGFALLLMCAGGSGGAAAGEAPNKPLTASVLEALRTHVQTLAGPELRGRGAWEDRVKAADYVAAYLKRVGFAPLPGRTSYFVDHGGTPEQPEVRNVCAWWPEPPADVTKIPEYVLLSAHYDHLGVKDGVVYPGADDNASGVAVLLELARAWIERERKVVRTGPPPRALCLVAFDLEEKLLVGSRRFVADPPVPLEKCSLFLTMDQMGRSLADLAPGTLFFMGSEHCAWLDDLLGATKPEEGVSHALLGIDFQPPTGYSDYVPFQEKKIPFLFVTTGACGHYHQPGDTPEKLDYVRMESHVRAVGSLVREALDVTERPTWRDGRDAPRLDEVRIVHGLIGTAIPKLDELNIQGPLRLAVTNFRAYLDAILARGAVTPAERTNVRNTARMLFAQAVTLLR